MAADVLDEVGLPHYVDAKGRHACRPALRAGGERKAKLREDALDVAVRHRVTEQAREMRAAEANRAGRRRVREHVGHGTDDTPRAGFLQKRAHAGERAHGRAQIRATLEPDRRRGPTPA